MQSAYPLINFDPIALALGPLEIHWYGVMYLISFLVYWWLGSRIATRREWWGWTAEDVSDFLFYGMLGVVLGGRLGYVLFYNFDSFLANPLYLFKIWEGGMSFHGGLLGVILAMAWYGRKTGRSFWQVADFVAPLAPIGLAFGRLGNFIGGELWGRYSDAPWAMIFASSVEPMTDDALQQAWASGALDGFARHPSQLYQFGLEGLMLFILLAWYSSRPRPQAAVAGLFMLAYGVFRWLVEFFREPDSHMGFIASDWLTMGMVLSIPMVIAGGVIMYVAYRRHKN